MNNHLDNTPGPDSYYIGKMIPDDRRPDLLRCAANDPHPEPLEAEYPTGWWIVYVVVCLLSVLAAAIWPDVWFKGWLS